MCVIMTFNLILLLGQLFKRFNVLNTEQSYKRQGHVPLKHFVGFLYNGAKPE